MPRAHLMSWEGAPYFRWVKMRRGVRYRISCADLRAPLFTKEGSAAQANDWWRKKLSEIEGRSARIEEFRRVAREEDELSRLYREVSDLVKERNQLRDRLLAFEAQVADEEGPACAERSLEAQVDLDKVLEMSAPGATTPGDKRLRHHADRFLALAQGEMRPVTYR